MKKHGSLLVLVALIMSVCVLSSCKKDVPSETPKLPDLVLNAENIVNYNIVRSDEANTDEKELYLELSDNIEKAIGAKIDIESDFLFDGQQPKEYEILVGETNREESVEIYKNIKYNDYVITVKGSKIVIAGGSYGSLKQAVEYFTSLLKSETLTLAGDYRYEYNSEYSVPELNLGGVSVADFKIVYASSGTITAANIIKDAIGEVSGHRVEVVSQHNSKTDHEIVVGKTSRLEYESLDYYNYEIFNDGSRVYLNAYDNYALNAAAFKLADKIKECGNTAELDDLNYEYVLPDKAEYIEDIDKLYMRWCGDWQPPEKMLDYSLKLDAFRNVSDRLLTCAHRTECYYYPENSIEGIISFYKMGGDVVELDIQATKDGVLVLMHDDDLDRMTNCSSFIARSVNGVEFPESCNVSDWTYEQIKYLNLKEGAGGSDAAVTSFKIPTLTEALKVCKGRLFIIPDKTEKWSYLPSGGKSDLFSCMKEADNYESIILSYGLTARTGLSTQNYIYDKSGVRPLLLIRDNSNPLVNVYNYLENNAVPGSFGVQVNGRFDSTSFPSRYASTYAALKGKVLMCGWTISDVKNGYPDSMDCEKNWKAMYDLGYRMIMTNKYLDLVRYAATKIK